MRARMFAAVLPFCLAGATDATARDLDPAAIAGAYQRQVGIAVPREADAQQVPPDGAPDSMEIAVTDELVIEPLAPDAAYVRADLLFSKYHSCPAASATS